MQRNYRTNKESSDTMNDICFPSKESFDRVSLSNSTRRDETFADLLLTVEARYGQANTRRDYGYAIKQSLHPYACTRLEDIPLDLDAFEKRFPKHGFNPTWGFATDGAYRAWRKKVLAVIRAHLGILDSKKAQKMIQDEWTSLLETAKLTAADLDLLSPQLIPLRILIDEARAVGLTPEKVTSANLVKIRAGLEGGRRKSFGQIISLLERLGPTSTTINVLLTSVNLPDAGDNSAGLLASHLLAEATAVIDAHCLGEYEPINDCREAIKSENTRKAYMAAFKKYLETAGDLDLLDGVPDLAHALSPDVFHAVVRAWNRNHTKDGGICERTRRDYVRTLKRFTIQIGADSAHLVQALKNNRELKFGKKKAETMSDGARAFCGFLLSGRKHRLTFQSLHIQFFKMSNALLETASIRKLSRKEVDTLRQTGTLAAMAAIWLWFCPLRISNMLGLTIHGPTPWLSLPGPHQDHARILIPGSHAKAKKPIDHRLERERNRALEIIEWYIKEIRPSYAGATASPYFFPSHKKGGKFICDSSVRTWLRKYCRALQFFQMNPHWFRHGIASLFLQAHPGAYVHVGTLLDDTPPTVRKFYGFVDDERLLGEAQLMWLKLADFMQENPYADPEAWKCP